MTCRHGLIALLLALTVVFPALGQDASVDELCKKMDPADPSCAAEFQSLRTNIGEELWATFSACSLGLPKLNATTLQACITEEIMIAVTGEEPGSAADYKPLPPFETSLKYVFDEFRLGDSYALVMARETYANPCDNDPIDKKARRFMVYGAQPCRDRSFPEATTVMFYLAFQKRAKYGARIEAFAYLGGAYYNSRSTFPVKIGSELPEKEGIASFAEPLGQAVTHTMTLARKRETLTATRFGDEVHLLDDGQRVVGVVVGKMPDDPDNEQWRGLMQMWTRYTLTK